jgi:hypothetical protein
MVNSEVWDRVVDWMVILLLWMEVLTAFGTVADWITLDEIFFINLNIGLPEWSKVFWSTGNGGFAPWVSVRIACWNRFLLSK